MRLVVSWLAPSGYGSRDFAAAQSGFGETALKTLFLLFMCFTLSAHAADLAESYLSVRNKAIADLAQDNTNPPLLDANESSRVALAKMGPLMRQIVGPLGIKGFPASGQSNVDTLDGSLGFGTLDGLRATSSDHRTTVVVTTEHLLRVWLAEHRNWWPNDPNNPPTDAEKAFKSNGFYTQALSNGAAAEIFGTLPLSPPPSGAAFGVVLTFAQDNIAPQPPEQIEVAVVRGSRVFLFNEKVRTRLGQIQSCTAACR